MATTKKRVYRKHGLSNRRLYFIWHNMVSRCHRPSHRAFRNYGGKGVRVCREWRTGPNEFMRWAMASGYADDLTIDRIRVEEGYAPGNCRWVPRDEQSGNRRNKQMYTAWGETKSMSDWLKDDRCTVRNRRLVRSRVFMRGWTPEKAMTQPV